MSPRPRDRRGPLALSSAAPGEATAPPPVQQPKKKRKKNKKQKSRLPVGKRIKGSAISNGLCDEFHRQLCRNGGPVTGRPSLENRLENEAERK